MSAIKIDHKPEKRPSIISVIFRQNKILLFAVLTITVVLYVPMFKNLLTNWDEIYILHNPYLKNFSFENFTNIFTVFYSGNYHPLTLLSLTLDYKLGGIHPWAYQSTNLLFHLCNTWLVYIFIKSLLKKFASSLNYLVIALITALLFGIHTLQVESVVWISERKNVLYTFFFLLSLIAYIKYLDHKTYKFYVYSVVLFMFSLLSKGMAVPLSLCIILIDYFAGRNLLSRKVILEKIPYLILALVFGYIAILAQHSIDAIQEGSYFNLLDRIAIASYGFIQYLLKLCFPFHLSAFYPYPTKTGTFLPFKFYAYIVLLLSFLIILWQYFRHHKMFLFGILFFMINISIVIQLLPVGDAIMSDRYVYVASIGFFFIIGYYGSVLWQKRMGYRIIALSVLTAYGLLLSAQTYHRVSVWKDSEFLWSDAITNYPENNDRAFQNLGNISYEKGNYPQALQYYNQVLQMHLPNKSAYSKAYIGTGLVKQALNDMQGALNDYNNSISYHPSYEGYYNRAVLKIALGALNDALTDLDKALEMDSLRTEAYNNRGAVFCQLGYYAEAMQNYIKVLQIEPQNNKAYLGRGLLKQAMNDMQGAMSDFNIALSMDPSYDGYLDRAVLKIALKDFEGALADLNQASQMDPLKPEVYINKGVIEMNCGNTTKALEEFNKAIEVNANDFRTYLCRGYAKISLADYQGAVADLDISIQLLPNAEAFYYRGRAKIQLGLKSEAYVDLQQAASMGYTDAKIAMQQNYK
jgi:tetratricopeptide (TPR) repeat protein